MNQSHRKKIQLLCLGYNIYCLRNLLFWQNDPRYDQYRIRVRLEHDPTLAQYIDDVRFEAVITPDSFARIALGFKHAYGIISLGLTIFWFSYMLLYKRWSYSTWNWEQRYLTILLVGLNIYNNPIYGVQLASSSAFFPYWNGICEVLYVGIALALWLTHIARFRRAVIYENYVLDRQEWVSQPHDVPQEIAEAGEDISEVTSTRRTISAYHELPTAPVAAEPISDFDPIINRQAMIYFLLAAVYVFLAGGLYLWSSLRDRMTPVISLSASSTGFQLLYYVAAGFYTVLVLLLTVQLCINAMGTRRHKDLLWGRYVFFATPTVILALSLVLGLFTTNVGPNATSMLGILCYSALFNGYVFFMLWAYWPADSNNGGFAPKDSAESASIFTEAAPSYASNL